jgi:hypothetical protein
MKIINQTQKITPNYVLITLAAVATTWIIHEFAHWLTGELLGNDMAMTLNGGYPLAGEHKEHWHTILIDTAGPAVTIIQALIAWLVIKKKNYIILFPFLATCFYMRLLAGGMNVINLNDEGRISNEIGLGTYTIPVLVVSLLFILVYTICRMKHLTAKFVTVTFLLIMVFSSVLILADQALKIRIF